MLKDSYKLLKPAIVAVVQRVSKDSVFPEIIGTGFIVNAEYGLIMTNAHVLRAIGRLPKVKGEDWSASILILKETPYGLLTLYTDVKAAMSFKLDELPMYTNAQPDMAILRVGLKDLPEATIKEGVDYIEGQEVATSGFPMGTMLLKDGATMHQIGPTLKSGIVSAVLPFSCDNPTALILNMSSQGGQSGSPIFDPTDGKVIGLLYAGAEEPRRITGATQDGAQSLIYRVPTDITYAVPVQYIKSALDKALDAPELKTHLTGEIESYNKYFEEALDKLKKGEALTVNHQRVDSSQIEYPPSNI